MTAAVPGVPTDAEILADVLDDHRPMPMPDPDEVECSCDGTVWERPDWRRHVGEAFVRSRDEEVAAALPSLREVIAAEALQDAIEHVDGNGIMRSGRDTDYWEGWDDGIQRAKSVLADLLATLSAPVQAAEDES